jgi:hypothetical protein
MQVLEKPKNSVPFTLLFVDKVEPSLYNEAIKNSELIVDSYNPTTQTSNLSVYAGTNLTYDTTGTVMGMGNDDSKQTDT